MGNIKKLLWLPLLFVLVFSSCILASGNLYKEPIYAEYLKSVGDIQAKQVPLNLASTTISAVQYLRVSDESKFSIIDDQLYWLSDDGWVEYELTIDNPGLYNIVIEYLPLGSQVFNIERGLQINGEYPFWQAHRMALDRQWRNSAYPFERDDFGNERRAFQEQVFEWQTIRLSDINGKYARPFLWYFPQGKNTIRIIGLRSQVVLKSISLQSPTKILDYHQPEIDENSTEEFFLAFEAENPLVKSHSSVMVQSSGDPVVSPREDGVTIYNSLYWHAGGEWVEWEFGVPHDGYYQIGLRFAQNFKHNMPTFRKIEIDGKVIAEELLMYPFQYDQNWQSTYIETQSGEPILFYLTEGTHRIRLTAVNEPVQPTIDTILNVISDLRELSISITMATGNNQDRFRDWDLETQIPDAFQRIAESAKKLRREYERLQMVAGKAPDAAANLVVSAQQLERLLERPELLPIRYQQLTIDAGSISEIIGNTILSLQNEPLQIDEIFVTSPGYPLPQGRAGLFSGFSVTINNFMQSFFKNYNAVGKIDDDTLEVWVDRGRDFVSVMQQLTDEMFTPVTGIKVAFSLMPREDQLILANSNGTPPDVATSVWYTTPFNLASRGALVDMSKFSDFPQVAARFHPGGFLSYHYLEGIYAVPETQNFWVLFYRKDIFDQLGVELPDTWDDVVELLPLLQQMGMNFYIPVSAGTGIKALFVMAPFFYQAGAELYSQDGLRTSLLTAEALAGFRRLTDLYTVYSLDNFVAWFFQNFRSGDIPLGVSDYNTYVQLKAAAPELEGLWGIVPMPGEKQPDGEVVRWAPGAMQSIIMFEQSTKQAEAWEWIKWWTSAEIQARFGNELEAMFSVAYRWNTANLEAVSQIPWTLEELDAITEQWRWLKDIPQVPGGYILERELSFAWNRVVIGTASGTQNPRLALHEADRNTHRELLRKQMEFGLIDENGEQLVEFNFPTINEPWDWKERVQNR